MTVRELIEKLSKVKDKNMLVGFSGPETNMLTGEPRRNFIYMHEPNIVLIRHAENTSKEMDRVRKVRAK